MSKWLIVRADYRIEYGKPVIYVFARNEHGVKERFVVRDFQPYFYVRAEEAEGLKGNRNVVHVGGEYEAIDREKVCKVITQIPSQVGELSKQVMYAYEDKVMFPVRWMIDKEIRASFKIEHGEAVPCEDVPVKLTKCYLDIEVEVTQDSDGNFSTIEDAIDGKQMILTVVVYFSEQDKWVRLTAKDEEEESLMLKELISLIKMHDPDVITGWNIGGFDLPVIVHRCVKHGIDYSEMSPMTYVDVRHQHTHVAGRNVFDLREAFRRYFHGRVFDSYALEDVCEREEFLGFPKSNFDYKNDMHRNNLEEILPYNVDDVKRCVELDNLLGLVDHFDGFRRIPGCTLDDSLATARYSDVLTLRLYKDKLVLGTKYVKRVREKFEGAEVLDPKTGLHENCVLIDFSGMYPSIIISYNISPETLIQVEWDDEKKEWSWYDRDRRKWREGRPPVDIAYRIGNVFFLKEPTGIIPKAVKQMLEYRSQIKNEMKRYEKEDKKYEILDLRQYALKQSIAAMYGYFAYVGSRLYYPDVSRSITRVGRDMIKETVEFMRQHEFIALYGDTDSMIIRVDGVLEEEGRKLEKIVNRYWERQALDRGLHTPPVIEFEYGFQSILLHTKKRYAGWCTWYKGREADEVIIKGFEAKRSDSAVLTRVVQKKILDMILKGGGAEEIREYVLGLTIKDKSIYEVGIPKPLRKPPEQYATLSSIRGILWANEFYGKSFQQDSRPYRFWIKKMKPPYPDRMVLKKRTRGFKSYKINRVALETEEELDEWREFVDWDLQKEKIIENKVGPILEAYGLSISEIMSRQKQTTLAAWG